MKKLFTLATVAFFGFSASYAQDPSTWKEGQDVTKEIQWKAYDACDEDPANPVWQGFDYAAGGSWEFRPAGTTSLTTPPTTGEDNNCPSTDFICWGVYNYSKWNVYQDFEIPAGVYTVSVSGCYREGGTGPTFDLWKAGKSTNNCFLYVKVGDEVTKTPLVYMFEGAATSPFYVTNGWTNDCHFKNAEGVEIYGPSCHAGADNYIEAGNFDGNSVTFIVSEKTTIRVGIDKPVEQAQDQGWWNHWKMEYVMAYNEETSKSFLAYQALEKGIDKAKNFADDVALEYNLLGSLMSDEVSDLDADLTATSSYEDIMKATEALNTAAAANEVAYTKAKGLSFMINVCKGVLKNTNSAYSGAADFEAAIKTAEDMINDEDGTTYESIEEFVTKAGALNKARVAYLMTQEKDDEGAIDMTHAISTPWFVNQEYTPHLQYVADNGTPVYQFPEEVETMYFGDGCPSDEHVNMEDGTYCINSSHDGQGHAAEGNAAKLDIAIADQAHWTNDETVENQWVYKETWNGWHGGFSGHLEKLKGYSAWYSAWAAGSNPNGYMRLSQVVTDLPDGFYTLEGRLFCSEGGTTDSGEDLTFATNGDEYLFLNDVKVKATEPLGFWSFWGRDAWITLKTDYVNVTGGKITLGYNHNDMAGNAGVVLKYHGTEINYNALVQKKLDEAGGSEELWAGDAKTYDAMIAKVVLPVEGADAYAEAIDAINDAVSFKKTCTSAYNSFKVESKYTELMNKYEDGDAPQITILEQPQATCILVSEGDDASYKDIAAVENLYNAYVEYINTYDRAEAMNSDLIKPTLSSQAEYLSANVATIDKLVEYSRALQTPMNEAAFAEMGADKATEASPINITSLLVNADLSEGPKTGWTCVVADPTVNTYGRQLAECWNQQPLDISQTLRSLPAGCYEFKVRACYRDGSGVDQNMIDRFAACEGDYSKLENNNAVIYANNCSEYIKSVVDGGWEEPSFTKWWNAYGSEEATNAGFVGESWSSTLCILPGEESILNEDDLAEGLNEIDLDNPAYPFDTKVGDKYYPSSMAGFKLGIERDKNVYCNSVRVMVEKGGDLKVGIHKSAAIGGDWIIYDDFELYYLGTETPTAIKNVNTTAEGVIYNVAGQRRNTLQKGINIVDGKKVFVK